MKSHCPLLLLLILYLVFTGGAISRFKYILTGVTLFTATNSTTARFAKVILHSIETFFPASTTKCLVGFSREVPDERPDQRNKTLLGVGLNVKFVNSWNLK